jgi:hypothetical protein
MGDSVLTICTTRPCKLLILCKGVFHLMGDLTARAGGSERRRATLRVKFLRRRAGDAA